MERLIIIANIFIVMQILVAVGITSFTILVIAAIVDKIKEWRSKKMKNEKGFGKILFCVIAGAIIIGSIMGIFIWDYKITYGNVKNLEITVKDKYIKRSGSEEDKYLVVDTDGNTYQVTDLAFKGKWNSTDLYNQLEIGKTYKVETSGIRNGFMSLYPNINRIENVEK